MKLEGEIGELDLIERLVELGRERFTGAVRFENDGIIKIIYFKGGDILSASTNDRTDSVDEILLRAGKVSRDHVKQALAKRKENETLGDALLGLGFITRKELTWARRVQVIGVIRSIAAWPAGSFQIVPDYLPKREEGTQFPLAQILVEVVVTDQDRAKFDHALDGGNAVFTKSDEFDFEFAKLGLNQDADAIAAWIDGQHSAAEVASLSGKDAFNVYKLLHALSLLGLVKKSTAAPVEDFGFAAEGVADASDAWSTPPAPELSGAPAPSPATTAARSAFDEEEEPATMEIPVPAPAPPPIAAPRPDLEMPPPILDEEPQWGFDDAQIETARRASIPISTEESMPAKEVVEKASKPTRWVGLLFAAVIVIAVAFGGMAAWNWWQQKNTPPPAPVVQAKPRVRKPIAAAVTPPPVTTTTATSTTANGAPAPPPALTPAPVTPPTPERTNTKVTMAPSSVTSTPIMKVTPSTTKITKDASGTATISNVGALPPVRPKSDSTRAHYDDMAKSFASQASGNYTVQFELVCETPSLTKAIQSGGSSVWFVPISYRSRPCYRVFWGHYSTQDEAKRAANEIPMGLRGVAPVVVKVPR